jgi:hypothetical protein
MPYTPKRGEQGKGRGRERGVIKKINGYLLNGDAECFL